MPAFALLLALAIQDRQSTGPVSDDEPPRTAPGRCHDGPDSITVCGDANQSGFRLRRPALPAGGRAFRPEVRLPGGGTARAEAEQRGVAPGVSVPALMFTARIPLGKGKKDRDSDDRDPN